MCIRDRGGRLSRISTAARVYSPCGECCISQWRKLYLKARSTPATMSKQRSTLLPKSATMSNEFCVEISSFRQSRTVLRQCCFHIVASMDRALVKLSTIARGEIRTWVLSPQSGMLQLGRCDTALIAIPSVCPSVCMSVCHVAVSWKLSKTGQYGNVRY